METLVFDSRGLIPAIAQDAITGDIRMVAWMNSEALAKTLRTGKATFFSRSRNQLWTKGETSGNTLAVQSIHVDCDRDTLLLRVRAAGPSCHTGRPTCFFRRLEDDQLVEGEQPAATFLTSLEQELQKRQRSEATKSYTKQLLDAGPGKIGEKVREEAQEFVDALANESAERVASEAADVVYHLMVGLRLRDVSWHRVIEVLQARSGQSGLEEKASRTRSS